MVLSSEIPGIQLHFEKNHDESTSTTPLCGQLLAAPKRPLGLGTARCVLYHLSVEPSTPPNMKKWLGGLRSLGCVWKCCVPLNPVVLLIIIPIKWLFHWEYTLFSDKPIWLYRTIRRGGGYTLWSPSDRRWFTSVASHKKICADHPPDCQISKCSPVLWLNLQSSWTKKPSKCHQHVGKKTTHMILRCLDMSWDVFNCLNLNLWYQKVNICDVSETLQRHAAFSKNLEDHPSKIQQRLCYPSRWGYYMVNIWLIYYMVNIWLIYG